MSFKHLQQDACDAALRAYIDGKTCREAAALYGISTATVRRCAIEAGVMRDRFAAMQLAAANGRLSSRKGKKRPPYSKEWRENMSKSKRAWADKHAKGITVKSSGHLAFTRRGENYGRSVHVVMMEERIGRRLRPDECVHHIDGNPANNDWNNLVFCTTAAHARLHRLQDAMAGKVRERNLNGTFKRGEL
jgi:hypothetical protein